MLGLSAGVVAACSLALRATGGNSSDQQNLALTPLKSDPSVSIPRSTASCTPGSSSKTVSPLRMSVTSQGPPAPGTRCMSATKLRPFHCCAAFSSSAHTPTICTARNIQVTQVEQTDVRSIPPKCQASVSNATMSVSGHNAEQGRENTAALWRLMMTQPSAQRPSGAKGTAQSSGAKTVWHLGSFAALSPPIVPRQQAFKEARVGSAPE
uniref:Putative secreted protein n=1 Tax=Ixodes ricinus TaxID=34613 RepID=A0A6B0V1Q2_IXORI